MFCIKLGTQSLKKEIKMANNVKFIGSAVDPKDYPTSDRPEMVVTGRSNAGKSSLINAITHSEAARVSSAPGKTRLLNFFNVGKIYRIVDLPGYGFASRSGKEMKDWGEMIEKFLHLRENIAVLVLLMDIRREWEEEEELLKKFAESTGKNFVVVLTKIDKCRPQEVVKLAKELRRVSGVEHVFPISSTKQIGIEEMEDAVFKLFIKNFKVE